MEGEHIKDVKLVVSRQHDRLDRGAWKETLLLPAL